MGWRSIKRAINRKNVHRITFDNLHSWEVIFSGENKSNQEDRSIYRNSGSSLLILVGGDALAASETTPLVAFGSTWTNLECVRVGWARQMFVQVALHTRHTGVGLFCSHSHNSDIVKPDADPRLHSVTITIQVCTRIIVCIRHNVWPLRQSMRTSRELD